MAIASAGQEWGRCVSEFTFTALTENHSILELVHKLVREPRITVSGPYLEGSVDTLDLGGHRSATERSPWALAAAPPKEAGYVTAGITLDGSLTR